MKWLETFLRRMVTQERSPHKLALSCAIGIYVAFCPFVGLHGFMAVFFAWLFRLNVAVTLTVTYLNNPLTTVPFFGAGYAVGYWVTHALLGTPAWCANPSFMGYINTGVSTVLGIPGVCFWSFIIGANSAGVLAGIITYPITKKIFAKLVDRHENYYTEQKSIF